MRLSRRWSQGLLVGCALLALGAGPANPDGEEMRQKFSGDWRYVGTSAERASVPSAVDRSVDGLFFIARGIAYDGLIHVCEICNSYSLSFKGGQVTVASPCQLSDVSPEDGSEVDHVTKAGDASKLSQRFLDGALVQQFRGEGGTRRVVWTLQPDQVSLLVHVTITSQHLPHPVDYTLSYKRAQAPAVAADAGHPDGG